MKSFFVLCDMLKAGFSFCNLGETANALDTNISASLSLPLHRWLYDKLISPYFSILC